MENKGEVVQLNVTIPVSLRKRLGYAVVDGHGAARAIVQEALEQWLERKENARAAVDSNLLEIKRLELRDKLISMKAGDRFTAVTRNIFDSSEVLRRWIYGGELIHDGYWRPSGGWWAYSKDPNDLRSYRVKVKGPRKRRWVTVRIDEWKDIKEGW